MIFLWVLLITQIAAVICMIRADLDNPNEALTVKFLAVAWIIVAILDTIKEMYLS